MRNTGVICKEKSGQDIILSLRKMGLLSAAAMYGAAHQQPMGYTVVTENPAPRNIEKQQTPEFFPMCHNPRVYISTISGSPLDCFY